MIFLFLPFWFSIKAIIIRTHWALTKSCQLSSSRAHGKDPIPIPVPIPILIPNPEPKTRSSELIYVHMLMPPACSQMDASPGCCLRSSGHLLAMDVDVDVDVVTTQAASAFIMIAFWPKMLLFLGLFSLFLDPGCSVVIGVPLLS